MAEIYENVIYRFIRDRGGSASKREIYEALGGNTESNRRIDEKLRRMERFGLIIIEGEEVKMK